MKKIFSAVILVLSLASCIKEVFEVPGDQNIDVTGTVTLNFGVTIPDAQTVSTKSISAQAIKSMTVIVFDERGYLVEAKDVDVTDYNVLDNNNTREVFKVTLHQSVSPRTLHFVANSPKAADDIPFGTEAEIMTSLVTSSSEVGGNVVYPDAYWQMVKVNRLLEQEKDTLCDNGGLLYSIPLIRNFAKITVVENLENFTLTGFELINIPIRGTVAPYNPSSGLGSFQQYFNSEKKGLNYIDLYQNYTGFMPMDFNPSTDLLPNIPGNNHSWNTYSKYTYERTYGDNPTAVLIKGKYGNGSETYYKAEIFGFIDGQPHNYNILRNIEYTITITNVLGHGYSTASAAADGVAGNNISYSAETQNYSNISDGNCRLFVEYISKRVVSNDQFTIKYKFVPDISSPNAVSNGVGGTNPIQITLAPKTEDDALTEANETGIPVIKRVGETAQWEVRKTSNDAIYVDSEGWSYIDITPNPVTLGQDTVLEEDMTFTATTEIDGQTYVLSRTVKLSKRNPYSIKVSCPKNVSRQLGAEVLVETYIPTGLDEFMFPLVFSIEASALTLYPNSGAGIVMPVVSGQSIITNQPKNTFHYERTLTYAEYEELVTESIDLDGEGPNAAKSMKLVPSYFKTNKAQSDTDVYVYNEYFGLANDSVVTATN